MIPIALTLGLALSPPAPPVPLPSTLPSTLAPVRTVAPAEDIEHLEAWPEPDRDQKSVIKKEIPRLVKDTMEGMAEDAAAKLIALGDVIVPSLMKPLGKAKNDAARERVEAVLDAVTDARHTRLLSAEWSSRYGPVRAWSMARVAGFPDPGLHDAAAEAWEATLVRTEKGKADEREPFAAALVVSSTGWTTGLPLIFESIQAKGVWNKVGPLTHTALGGVRGEAATVIVRDELLPDANRKGKIAALRLLGGCGDSEITPTVVAPFLEQTDNGILIAAINALRGAVDGEPPIAQLSTFEAIERARAWKARL